MEKNFSRRKILVAGAKGMVGSAICRALKRSGYGILIMGFYSYQKIKLFKLSELQEWFKKTNLQS